MLLRTGKLQGGASCLGQHRCDVRDALSWLSSFRTAGVLDVDSLQRERSAMSGRIEVVDTFNQVGLRRARREEV